MPLPVLKKPNILGHKLGKHLTFEVELKEVRGFSATCAAMSRIGPQHQQDTARKNDDFTATFEALLNAFDSFKKDLARKVIFDLSKEHHASLSLAWILRHTCVHKGRIVDQQAALEYEKTYSEIRRLGTPVSDEFLDKLTSGMAVTINQKLYDTICLAVFKLIEEKVSPEDLEIFKARAWFAEVRGKAEVEIACEQGIFQFSLSDALDAGATIKKGSAGLDFPSDMIYDDVKKSILIKSTGLSFPAIRRPNV